MSPAVLEAEFLYAAYQLAQEVYSHSGDSVRIQRFSYEFRKLYVLGKWRK